VLGHLLVRPLRACGGRTVDGHLVPPPLDGSDITYQS
jgi:hypothetical protein